MNKFESELLRLNYETYVKTDSRFCTYRMLNSHDFVYYITGARYLSSQGLINPLSDNIFSDSINILDNLLKFEITDKGISYFEKKLER